VALTLSGSLSLKLKRFKLKIFKLKRFKLKRFKLITLLGLELSSLDIRQHMHNGEILSNVTLDVALSGQLALAGGLVEAELLDLLLVPGAAVRVHGAGGAAPVDLPLALIVLAALVLVLGHGAERS